MGYRFALNIMQDITAVTSEFIHMMQMGIIATELHSTNMYRLYSVKIIAMLYCAKRIIYWRKWMDLIVSMTQFARVFGIQIIYPLI